MTYKQMIDNILGSGHIPRWTKTSIAKACGVSRVTIGNLYSGRYESTMDSTANKLRALHKKVCGKG